MTDDQVPKTLPGSEAASGQLLKGAVARFEAIRAEGETLIDAYERDGSWPGIFERWRRRWGASLEEVQALCRSQAPLQAEMISWPLKVDGDTPPTALACLMRTAKIGTRETRLLTDQLVDDRSGDQTEAQPQSLYQSDETSHIGTRYFRSGQRFEGAVAIRKLIERAQSSILVVDGYVSEDTLILANAASIGVTRHFLTLNQRSALTGLRSIWNTWAGIWNEGGAECRAVSRPPLPHSRYLYVDGARYFFDASLKDVGSSLTHFRLLEPAETRVVEAEVNTAWVAAVPL